MRFEFVSGEHRAAAVWILFAAVPDPISKHWPIRLGRRRDVLVAPRELCSNGYKDFVAAGDDLLVQCVTRCGLLPDARVLEVGSGFGQFARALSHFLAAGGSYDGFDIDDEAVTWCQGRYAQHVNFHFAHVDLFNAARRPEGVGQASEFWFPYGDQSFDLIIGASVLTHLVTAEAEHYLGEMARVLAPGGRVLVTFFLLDLGSRAAITQGRATLRFDLEGAAGPMAVVDPELPEGAVAFDHHWLDAVLDAAGLRRIDAVPGSWRGERAVSYQDLVVLERLE